MVDNVRYATANNLRFAYLEQGDGPLVLLLHGFPDNAETYCDTMAVLAHAGYRAVAPYLRGYTPTELPDDPHCDPLTLAKDLAGLIDALAADGIAHVIGMDWGGTSIQAALTHCPERLGRAVVMNAAHPSTLSRFALDPHQVREVFHFWFFQMDVAVPALAASDLAMVDYLWQLWSPGYDVGAHRESVKATLAAPGVLPVALRYYGDLYRSAQDGTFPLEKTDVPTLSIFGATDPTATYAHLEEPWFTGAYERIILDGVGHWPHLEAPATVHPLILDWLAGTRRPR